MRWPGIFFLRETRTGDQVYSNLVKKRHMVIGNGLASQIGGGDKNK
jgi:hypothetical protein